MIVLVFTVNAGLNRPKYMNVIQKLYLVSMAVKTRKICLTFIPVKSPATIISAPTRISVRPESLENRFENNFFQRFPLLITTQ